jgi:hypothetical protein
MSQTEKQHNFSYTPKATVMTKTYQPKGPSQAPLKVPPLVSGVAPVARPAQSASVSTGGGKK